MCCPWLSGLYAMNVCVAPFYMSRPPCCHTSTEWKWCKVLDLLIKWEIPHNNPITVANFRDHTWTTKIIIMKMYQHENQNPDELHRIHGEKKNIQHMLSSSNTHAPTNTDTLAHAFTPFMNRFKYQFEVSAFGVIFGSFGFSLLLSTLLLLLLYRPFPCKSD